ncbi:ABC transporter substrate-binding protein [Campylobacter curvus]|uniref:ABC transporter substrate-binding protein n=1 Tax=Campylobacter curvus TaxID=200 RepID=UPI000374D0FD|nr:ABC transporter substrate-binding protein [Campylobacter curvus]QKF61985.1 heme ABC transporter ChuBCD, periplasmic substrate-binding protein [Campylobacter curvus]UEB50274.1 ABC transporter substrate-binding protein [Campylobacter curvus]
MFRKFKILVSAFAVFAVFASATTTMDTPKKRLVILDPAVVEMMYMLGAEDQIAAISTLTMSKIWPEDKTALLKSVGTYTKPNFEKIVELKPDLVVTSFHSANVNEDLKKFNLPTLTLKADSVDMIYSNIEQIGKITGKEQKAHELVEGIKQKFKTYESGALKGKKIIAIFSGTPITAFNSKTLPGDIFKRLGLVNLADSLQGSTPIVSPEFILGANPDFIVLVGGMGGSSESFLKENPVLAKTNAAKNGKILTFPSSILLRGTPRIGEGVDKIYNDLLK